MENKPSLSLRIAIGMILLGNHPSIAQQAANPITGNKLHTINLHFVYPSTESKLLPVKTDQKRLPGFYEASGKQGTVLSFTDSPSGNSNTTLNEKNFFSKPKVTDPQALKQEFLKTLEDSIPEGSTVRLDWTGHGVMGTDGKWYLQLPYKGKLPNDLFTDQAVAKPGDEIQGGLKVNGQDRQPLKVNTNHADFKGHFLSMDEFAQILERRKVKDVYGTLGSCHSGGVSCSLPELEKKGIRSSFLAGAPIDRTMTGYEDSGSHMSDFLNQVRKEARNDPKKYDLDGNQQITWNELIQAAEKFNFSKEHKRTSAMGNKVVQDIGFQSCAVGSGSCDNINNQVVFDLRIKPSVSERNIPSATKMSEH